MSDTNYPSDTSDPFGNRTSPASASVDYAESMHGEPASSTHSTYSPAPASSETVQSVHAGEAGQPTHGTSTVPASVAAQPAPVTPAAPAGPRVNPWLHTGMTAQGVHDLKLRRVVAHGFRNADARAAFQFAESLLGTPAALDIACEEWKLTPTVAPKK
jgi:hypothetical protein